MSRLIIVSNKLPFEITQIDGNTDISEKSVGVSRSLTAFHKYHKCSWIGWTGNEDIQLTRHQKEEIYRKYEKENCFPIELDEDEVYEYQNGFCNQTIWPLFHYFQQYSEFNTDYWHTYRRVNMKFAERVLENAEEGDMVWIHDYHLMLLPKMIRDVSPELSIGFFLHIPFPSFELFRLLPWRNELLEGIMGADLVGFHTFDYERHFMSSIRRLMGYDNVLSTIKIDERLIKIDNFPMGIDFRQIQKESAAFIANSGTSDPIGFGTLFGQQGIKKGNIKLMLSIDRLDYTKGIPTRLEGYEKFLMDNPDYLEKITLALFVIPSREIVSEYKEQKRRVDELAGRINGEFGTSNWMPILYYYRSLTREETIELYTLSDIALITPFRDGMNLMAKEYIASRTEGNGVLILSEMAGAAKEMSESILVNPNNKTEISEAIYTALNMSDSEQIKGNEIMQHRLEIYNEEKWAQDILNSLENIKLLQETNLTRKVSQKITESFRERFNAAKKRIIFLDYDGTLTGFHNDPQKASPDEDLYRLLRSLISDERNKIVVISGRDKETLGKWFSDFEKATFIAEHGVWIKSPGNDWSMFEQIDKEWMETIRPVIRFYVDRTPRSLLEEKNYSLVWHYRHSDPDLGIIRSWELKDELRDLVSNLNLEIMDGDKVIEVKNSGVNKGRAAARQLKTDDYDFIMAIGDDWTDEYTFGSMPEEAITIKVGTKSTSARFYIDSVNSVRNLLSSLAGKNG